MNAIAKNDPNPEGEPRARLIIHWRELRPYDAVWMVRGLSHSGQYYGELTASSLPMLGQELQKSGMSFAGNLTANETQAVWNAADLIRGVPSTISTTIRLGLLAEGEYSAPNLLYEHFSDSGNVEVAGQFGTIISIFRPHFDRHLDRLREIVARSR